MNKKLLGGVLLRRLKKTLPPYVVWSVVAALVLNRADFFGVLMLVFTGGASAQMYFLLVYAQLIVLTPLLYKLLRSCKVLVYAITPVSLVIYEVATAMGFAYPIVGRLFPVWLLFYVVGLDWQRWRSVVEGKFKWCVVVWCVCLCVQLIEGFCWSTFGNFNMATTQLKLSSMFSSLAIIGVIMTLPDGARLRISKPVTTSLGDASFGIYLCHILVLAVVGKVLGLVALPDFLAILMKWAFTLALSYLFCVVVNKVLPKKIAKVLGC